MGGPIEEEDSGSSTYGMHGSQKLERKDTFKFDPNFQSIKKLDTKDDQGKQMSQSQSPVQQQKNCDYAQYSLAQEAMLKQWQSTGQTDLLQQYHNQNEAARRYNAGPSSFGMQAQYKTMESVPDEGRQHSRTFPSMNVPVPGGIPYNQEPQGNLFNMLNGGQGGANFSGASGPQLDGFALVKRPSGDTHNPFSVFGTNHQPYMAGSEYGSGGQERAPELPPGFPLRRMDCYEDPALANLVGPNQGNNYPRRPSLYDQFENDRREKGNDPYFYQNMQLPPDSRAPMQNRLEVSEAVLRGSFNRYASHGAIDTGNFMKLIEEIYSFERRPVPSYLHCLYIMSKYDVNRDGCIDFDEFKVLMREI